MIAMADYRVKPHFVECGECNGWYDPNENPTTTVSRHFNRISTMYDCDICVNCVELLGIATCAGCAEPFEKSDLNDCNGEYLCEDCANRKGWYECYSCHDWIGPDDSHTSPDGNHYCEDCFWDTYTCCEGCNDVIYHEDAMCTDDSHYCSGCYSNHHDEGNFDWRGFRDRLGCTTYIGSERCFGLELETDDCDGYTDLDGSRAWGAKDDCSISGKEFVSDILSGDAGLAAVAELTDFAEANGWDAGRRCGYHLHIDMRNESNDSLRAAAYAYCATSKLWHEFVDSNRRGNGFCCDVDWDIDDLVDWTGTFRNFVYNHVGARQTWINLRAHIHHNTFEIRLHHATLDELAVCNWIKAHTRFVDWACTVGLDEVRDKLDDKSPDEQFDFIVNEVWRDEKLGAYYAERSSRINYAVAVA